MIQSKDDKKEPHQPFRGKVLMKDMDVYLKVHFLPQLPAEYKEIRTNISAAMDNAWRALFKAATTSARERQRNLVVLKVELSMVENYVQETRDICYRGKAAKNMDANIARRYRVLAKKQSEMMSFVWAWAKNEDAKLDSSKTQKTAGLMEKEEV